MVTGTGILLGGVRFIKRNFAGVLLGVSLPFIAAVVLNLTATRIEMQRFHANSQFGTLPVLSGLFLLLVTLSSGVIASWLSARMFRLRLRAEFPAASGELAATLHVCLWLHVALAACGIPLVMVVEPLLSTGARFEFLPAQSAPMRIAAGAAAAVVLIYSAQLLVRLGFVLPRIATGWYGVVSAEEWRKAGSVSWSVLGWLLLTGAGIALMVYPLLTLLLTRWGRGEPGGITIQMIGAQLLSDGGALLFVAVAAIILAEGYAQLNRPRG